MHPVQHRVFQVYRKDVIAMERLMASRVAHYVSGH